MTEPFEIKHKEPALRHTVADYPLMFSGSNLKLIFFWLGMIAVFLVGWFVTPSSVDPSVNIILRVLAIIDAYFLVCVAGFFVLMLAAPLLAHFILPLVITLLEVVRVLVSFTQYLIDQVLIEPLIHSFLYPTRQDDTTHDT